MWICRREASHVAGGYSLDEIQSTSIEGEVASFIKRITRNPSISGRESTWRSVFRRKDVESRHMVQNARSVSKPFFFLEHAL